MQLTVLETRILTWIAEQHPELGASLAEARPIEREHTGAGRYVTFRRGPRDPGAPVSGPSFRGANLDVGGGSLLWLVDGAPGCLELYGYGDAFPEVVVEPVEGYGLEPGS